jgi:CSLREA domain-containing protein
MKLQKKNFRNLSARLAPLVIFAVFAVVALAKIITPVESKPETDNGVLVRVKESNISTVKFKDAHALKTDFAKKGQSGQPTAMDAEDLDQDGFNDLIVGYGSANGGFVTVQRGNKEAFQPESPEVLEGIRNAQFPEPFLAAARTYALPESADFVATGDFNADGKPDVIAAARNGSAFYLLGSTASKKGLSEAQRIEVDGNITALATGDVRNQKLGANVFVALSDARIVIFDFAASGAVEKQSVVLPSAATTIVPAHLDTDAVTDLAIATANGEIFVLHNSLQEKDGVKLAEANEQKLEKINSGFAAETLAVGNFIVDRDAKNEIAVLTTGGAIRVLSRGDLERQPLSPADIQKREDIIERGDAVALRNWEAAQIEAARYRQKTHSQMWRIADDQNASGYSGERFTASPSSRLIAGRMLNGAGDDLLVIDAANRQTKILPLDDNSNRTESAASPSVTLDAEKELVTALPIRTGVMAQNGLIMLHADAGTPVSSLIAAPAATFVVNTTTDAVDSSIGDGICRTAANQCSLRAAISEANFTAAADSITFSINGTFNITLSGTNENNNSRGDFDVREDLTITGNGAANTILTVDPAQTQRIIEFRVTDSVGENNSSMTGLTVQGGKGTQFGGGVRFDGFNIYSNTVTGTFNLSGVTIQNNTSSFDGGGIWATGGDTTITNSTITGNTVTEGDGGGVNYGVGGGTALENAPLTITNSTISNNQALDATNDTSFFGRGGGVLTRGASSPVHTIMNSTVSGNNSEVVGGGYAMESPTTVSGGSITGNCAGCNGSPTDATRGDGGGVFADMAPTVGTHGDSLITGVTITGNQAKGDGGGVFLDRDTLTISSSTIGNAGAANTAVTGGGGIAANRTLGGAGETGSLTINSNTTIRGNTTQGDGGGILNGGGPNNEGRTLTINGGASIGGTAAGQGNSAVNGGGIAAKANNTVSFTGTSIQGNAAQNNGGGIWTNGGAVLTLNNAILQSNKANSDGGGGGDGGAFYQNSGTSNFTGTLTVGGSGAGNSAANGGGFRNNAGTLTLPGSAVITHNTATANGGGISNSGALSALTSPTITNNSAANGGGIYNSNGALAVSGGSISNNTASGKGGGIEHSGSGASSVTNAQIQANTGSGVYITGAASLDAVGNTITNNTGDGITKIGTGAGSHFNDNTIHSNGENGIDLADNGVSANDTNDTDAGPNNLQNFPVINYVRRADGVANVTLNAPNGRYRIQYYANAACDASGHGEGEALIASQIVNITAGNSLTFFSSALAFGAREQITATATSDPNGNSNFDDDGSTSEFSACRRVNTLPTISAQANVSRQQGSTVSNSQVATVGDIDQAANTLTMSVNGGNSATVNGVTVSGLSVDSSGAVTANIVASCSATNANFTLRVTDGATEFREVALPVTVTPNTAPLVGNYANTTVNSGSSVTITPNAAPTDNGSIASVTATASAGFTGTFSTNTATGAVTVNNAAPAENYTITVTTTDNCGAATVRQFILTVNAIPVINGGFAISRQQGSAASNSQIAAVIDADQAEETLTVTVRPAGAVGSGASSATSNGVTVSNIVVSPTGAVTADIVASCSATNAGFTLRVTDSNGAFTETAMNAAVTANTAPTIGNYPNTTVAPGGNAVINPSAAHADNGSVASLTVSASGGFSGTLTTNAATGVVTVSGANPVGTYTVTVTTLDNCGTATVRQFSLIVTTPPTVTAASNLTRAQGGLSSNSQIAVVNDVDQAENTLIFTVNGGSSATVNGVTVSDISIDNSGNVTANIVAAAGASSATFTLRVTDAQGAFAETTLAVAVAIGGYEADVAPRPNGNGNGSVNAGDVTQIQRFAVGLDQPFQSNEFQRADSAPRLAPDGTTPMNGNGAINSGDVTQAQRYAVNLDGGTTAASGPTAPPAPFSAPAADQSGEKTAEIAADDYLLNVARESLTSTTVTIAVQLTTAAGATGASSVGGTLSFDTSVVTTPTNIRLGGGVPAGTSFFVNDTDAANGRLGFTINAPVNQTFAEGEQRLLLIDFTIAGTNGAQFSFDDSQAQRFIGDVTGNELAGASQFATATVSVAPTAAGVTLAGRIMTANSRAVGQAFVTLTNSSGQIKTVISNPFGYFKFSDVAPGDYVVNVGRKGYKFEPVMVSAQNDLSDLMFTVQALE